MLNKKVGLFDLDVYIHGNEQICNLIYMKLKEKDLTVRALGRRINLTSTSIYHFLKGNAMRTRNLRELINFLGISERTIEDANPTIYSGPYKYRKYLFKFPLIVTPLHIRLISHFIGDSALEKYHCRWYQKSEIGGSKIKELIKKLSGIKINDGKKYSYGIPIILSDIVSSLLGLKRSDLTSNKFVDKVAFLPKEYGIQLLAAFIVDEGHISKSSISLSNTNLKLLKSIKNLIISLGYACSDVKTLRKTKDKVIICGKECNVNHDQNFLFIYAGGLLKFATDIKDMSKRYGGTCNLWQKQSKLEEVSTKVDLNKINKSRHSKTTLLPSLLESIKRNPLKVSDFAMKFDLDYIRAYKLFFRLKEKGKIKKIHHGIFADLNYKGPIPRTVKQDILDFCKGKNEITIKQISEGINRHLKSVSVKFTNLHRNKFFIKIRKGVYMPNFT
jgi:hypothetical protein